MMRLQRLMSCMLFAALIAAAPVSNPATTLSLPEDVENVLRWLPPDSQTLMVDRNPSAMVKAVAALKRDVAPNQQQGELRDVLPIMAMGLEIVPFGQDLVTFLSEQTPALVVEGSRHFRPPANLGLLPYHGAHVIVLKSHAGE